MQMMMVDSGQPYYQSATMLGSVSAILYWVLAGAIFLLCFPPSYLAKRPAQPESV